MRRPWGMGARALTTLADFATLFLGSWSLWVMLMPRKIDENTHLLQWTGDGERASGGVSTISRIISAIRSFYFLRRARAAEHEARVAAHEARVAAEAARDAAYEARDAEHEARVSAEASRGAAYEARVAVDTDREASREIADASREIADASRDAAGVAADASRDAAYEAGEAADANRGGAREIAGAARVAAHEARVVAEAARVAAHEARVAAHEARVATEAARDGVETDRETVEIDRAITEITEITEIARTGRIAAETDLLRVVINTGWRVWMNGEGDLQTKLRQTSEFLEREVIADRDRFLADFNTISEQATGASFEKEAYTILDTTFHQLPAEIQSEFIYEAEIHMLSAID